jgi:hypothetical protein
MGTTQESIWAASRDEKSACCNRSSREWNQPHRVSSTASISKKSWVLFPDWPFQTDSRQNNLFEGVLETIENSPYANDPADRIARGLIDGMAQVAATGGTLKPKADR